ncbi:hypothetical protein X566_14995 [Afipia sp. P52-10]|uniref:hypothetical protein n=1 Tax=Afipia sp. P52-10 TaxID=1429916 RepID=UPI0003DF3019|nr:hypothetical protein [Afipia sp. P52-10]ETR78811.1 hypothetical protein X566_14995 [Afipia sp. P52-10]
MSGIGTAVKQLPLAQPKQRKTDGFRAIQATLREFMRSLFDTYHPEAHYMRGPGPACAAKQAHKTR